MYNVERYLGDFIGSIEAQSGFLDGTVEVVAVDDGSTDGTLSVLRNWAGRWPGQITVIAKENGGQSSARNLGMSRARGEWVTFIDPDDALADDYIEAVRRMIDKRPDTQMVATPRIIWQEATNRRTKSHPTQWMFASDQHVNLDKYPDFFHGSAATAFFRRQVIDAYGLTFDARVRPNFEDGHFIVRYLLTSPEPVVAFTGSAHYYYRKRADGSSTVQNSSFDPGYYLSVPRWGYLESLKFAKAHVGRIPEWLQSLVLYELSWYFRIEEAASGAGARATGSVAAEFRSVLAEIAPYLDAAHIRSIVRPRYYGPWREYLAYGIRGQNWHTPFVVFTKYDERAQQVRISYRYTGQPPKEEILLRGDVATPIAEKRRAIEYFGATHVWERIVWISAKGTVRVRLDGEPMELRKSYPGPPGTTIRPRELRAWLTRGRPRGKRTPRSSRRSSTPRWVRFALHPQVQRRVGRPWVLVDRLHNAGDSAEVLFRYLRTKRRDINAWFVVDRDSSDFRRLRSEGFKRIVSPGSLLWKILMVNADVVVSSHADVPITHHPEIVRHVTPRYKFAFLQHGVIKDDLSPWLNKKDLDLFVTSTPSEHSSIISDGTPYIYTTREVKLTGLPRFDALLRANAALPEADKKLVVFAPTWRYWLVPPTKSDSQRRALVADFQNSEFARSWAQLIGDERILDEATRSGMALALLPHPNLQAMLDEFDVPPYIEPLSFEGDAQKTFARARVLVTDYSSMAFNAAYLDRSVVYYQFDFERFNSGGHVGRKGYFEYGADGFGPVTTDYEQAVQSIIQAIRDGGKPSPHYQARIDSAFPMRDGRASVRVTSAIEQMLKHR